MQNHRRAARICYIFSHKWGLRGPEILLIHSIFFLLLHTVFSPSLNRLWNSSIFHSETRAAILNLKKFRLIRKDLSTFSLHIAR